MTSIIKYFKKKFSHSSSDRTDVRTNVDWPVTRINVALKWADRMQIVVGIAQGVTYLHGLSILHGDLTSENILIDQNLDPVICDFDESITFENTNVLPTPADWAYVDGYADPYCIAHGTLDLKYDIYSFGVLLMEIISAHPAYVAPAPGREPPPSLPEQFSMGFIHIDHQLGSESTVGAVANQIELLHILAKECTSAEGRDNRPAMEEVLRRLREISDRDAKTDEVHSV